MAGFIPNIDWKSKNSFKSYYTWFYDKWLFGGKS